ncbi:MAG: polysaccharide pyruvyl transferase family protein [Candidatus Pristimantibacillus sp.]
MKKVLLAGVPQSPNLGDGLIAYTMNRLIAMRGEHQVIHFDLLQGRCDKSMPMSSVRGGLHYSLASYAATPAASAMPAPLVRLNSNGSGKKMTPDTLRRLKAYWLHRRKDGVLNSQLRQAVKEAEAVYIGGGHLLIDTYWTFPLGVKRVMLEAKRQGKPLHILLVGARGPWSSQGRRWLLDACRYATTIAVRDEDSRQFLLAQDSRLANKTITLADPALYTPEAFGLAASSAKSIGAPTAHRTVGLGIMDPHEMNRHCELRWDREECAAWWNDATAALTATGCTVKIFTNGAATDNAFVEHYVKPLCQGMKGVEFLPYPSTVEQLVESIAECDSVIAQRLHACIPALALGKPTYGLIWDRKLENIFTDLGMSSYLIDFRKPAWAAVASVSEGHMPSERIVQAIREKKEQLYDHIGRILP